MTIDSGLLPDSVADLASRGLLIGDPVATYLAGGPRLYAWVDGRPLCRRPVRHRGDHGQRETTLVPELSRPVSTPSQDVNVVVTERGEAELRGLSRPERHRALKTLWDI